MTRQGTDVNHSAPWQRPAKTRVTVAAAIVGHLQVAAGDDKKNRKRQRAETFLRAAACGSEFILLLARARLEFQLTLDHHVGQFELYVIGVVLNLDDEFDFLVIQGQGRAAVLLFCKAQD